MSYLLKTVHNLVNECENVANGLAASSAAGEWKQKMEASTSEITAFSLCFLETASAAPGREALSVKVETSCISCTSLLNSLDHLCNIPGDSPVIISKKEDLLRLQSLLLLQLTWLRAQFSAYTNQDESLPRVLAREKGTALQSLLGEHLTRLQLENTSSELVAILEQCIGNLLSQPSGITYNQLAFARSVIDSISVATGSNSNLLPGEAGLSATAMQLLELNLNEPAFIKYVISQLQDDVAENISSLDVLSRWQYWLKKVQQVAAPVSGLHPQAASAKEAVLSVIRHEIASITQKEEALASIYGSRTAVPAAKRPPLTTTLSVSQLAVFCRLFHDCNIIQHPNQSELLKTIAGALQTTRTSAISPESLRVKYYAPDAAAINIAKEHLHTMLAQLRKY